MIVVKVLVAPYVHMLTCVEVFDDCHLLSGEGSAEEGDVMQSVNTPFF